MNKYRTLVCALLVSCTVLGLAGTDLVLPAIPTLPNFLDGTQAQAQLVLASYIAGICLGLLLFGQLSSYYDQRRLLVISMVFYGVFSLAAGMTEEMTHLIALRLFQGISSSCAAVIAPGIIKAIFSRQGAIKAIGFLSSVESLTPAFAPILGAYLYTVYDWSASFYLTASMAFFLAIILWFLKDRIPDVRRLSITDGVQHAASLGNYYSLLVNASFQRYALSQAMALGGLIVFVLGAPAVIVNSMNGSVSDFIVMQICGISTFIIGANLSGKLVGIFGSEKTIWFGTLLSLAGCFGILLFSLIGSNNPHALWLLFVPLNMGVGFRGPPSFYEALVASEGNDAKASALVILSIMLVVSVGTALAAPFISFGLVTVACAATMCALISTICLICLPVYGSAKKNATGIR